MTPYIRLGAGAAVPPGFGLAEFPAGVFHADDAVPVVVRRPDGGVEVRLARWGMPSPGREVRTRAIHRAYRERARLTDAEFERFAADEPNPGVAFIDPSAFVWRPSLEPPGRCVVPFSAVGALDPEAVESSSADYIRAPENGLAYLGGVFESGWRGVRRAERGRETVDLFGLVSVERIVQADLNRKRFTPIVLTGPAEVELWLTAPWAEAKILRRQLGSTLPPDS